jgi:hypothetical protein
MQSATCRLSNTFDHPNRKANDMQLRDNGTLVHDGIVIGNVTANDDEDAEVILNLGWCAAAGVDVTIQGNPNVEARRIVLKRVAGSQPTTRGSSNDQQSLDA